MSKELKALQDIKDYIEDNITTKYNHIEPEIEVIETALKRLEQIYNLQQELGCPLEVVITPYYKRGKLEVLYRGKMREVIRVVAFEEATRPYMEVWYRDDEKSNFKTKTIWLDDYKKTWWLKENKEE